MSETSAPNSSTGPLPGLSAAESAKMQAALQDIAQRSQKLLEEFAHRYKADGPQPADPLRLTQTFMDFTAKMLADPNKLLQMLQQLIAMLSGGLGANPTAPPSAPLDSLGGGAPQPPLPF